MRIPIVGARTFKKEFTSTVGLHFETVRLLSNSVKWIRSKATFFASVVPGKWKLLASFGDEVRSDFAFGDYDSTGTIRLEVTSCCLFPEVCKFPEINRSRKGNGHNMNESEPSKLFVTSFSCPAAFSTETDRRRSWKGFPQKPNA